MTQSRDPVQDAAFSKFYRDEVPGLIIFVRYLGAPLEVAADCVQHTMLKALPPAWATLTNPRAWCRQVCLNTYRRHVARSRETPVSDIVGLGDPLLWPDTGLQELEGQFEVARLLAQLSPRRREVMACLYAGASYREVAELLDITEPTVRSTHRHARRELTTLLNNSWGLTQ